MYLFIDCFLQYACSSSSESSSDSEDEDVVEIKNEEDKKVGNDEEEEDKKVGNEDEKDKKVGDEIEKACDDEADDTKQETSDPEVVLVDTSSGTATTSVTPAVHINPEDRLPSSYVIVNRTPEFEEGRQQLPILFQEQFVMETINEKNNVMIVIVGPTGSGKTTQVPQFLYEKGYAR